MNHSEWRTCRHRRLLGEHLHADPECDRVYEEADLAERRYVDVDDIEATELLPIAVIIA